MSLRPEFDGPPLVHGSIIGLRSMNIHKLTGKLESPNQRHCWKPGINYAQCYRGRWANHRVAERDCACGFYAYWNGADTYATTSDISVVVRATGLVSLGSEGFRAEKMEIIAIEAPEGMRQHFRYKWYKEPLILAPFTLVVSVLNMVMHVGDDTWWFILFLALLNGFLLGMTASAFMYAAHRGSFWPHRRPPEVLRRVMAAYPDVEIVENKVKAAKALGMRKPVELL